MNGREAGVTVPISVDTYHSTVAEQAVDAGADIVNDISAGEDDPEMFSFLAGKGWLGSLSTVKSMVLGMKSEFKNSSTSL